MTSKLSYHSMEITKIVLGGFCQMTRITLVVFVKVQEKYVLLFFYSNNNDKLKSKKGTETKNPVSCEK